jgi:hypothetical protein
VVTRAAESGVLDDAGALRHALSRSGETVSLPLLLRIVERVRQREASEPAAPREEWRLTRAAAHLSLANRGSRLALYDLRESLGAATAPLPVEFLAALSLIGDASCLEAIAGKQRNVVASASRRAFRRSSPRAPHATACGDQEDREKRCHRRFSCPAAYGCQVPSVLLANHARLRRVVAAHGGPPARCR